MTLKFTSSTCVHYHAGDKVGKLLAYVSLLPYAAILHVCSTFHAKREVHMLVILAGFVANEAVARGLKHGLRHPRPLERCEELHLCHSYGMPSSHTQCITFALVLRVLLLLRGYNQKGAATKLVGALESAALAAITAGVAAARVYLGYHSQDQVLAALGLGCVMALIWRGVLSVLAPLYPQIAATRLGRWGCLTDSWGQLDPFGPQRKAKQA